MPIVHKAHLYDQIITPVELKIFQFYTLVLQTSKNLLSKNIFLKKVKN